LKVKDKGVEKGLFKALEDPFWGQKGCFKENNGESE